MAFVGLLTPSGIYADKTAANFFKAVSTTGRVAGLFDFENRRLGTDLPPFFPDVDSRFKFCALILGGEERTVRPDQMRLLPTRHGNDQCPRSLLPIDACRLRSSEPEHRHCTDLPHSERCRDHPPDLRAASGAGRSLKRAGTQGMACEVYAHVRHGQRLPPLPHRRRTRC